MEHIKVYDNFLTQEEILQLDNILINSDFYLMGTSSKNEDRGSRDWTMVRVIENDDKNIDFYNKLQNRILELVSVEVNYSCYRKMVNSYKFGDVLTVHSDHEKIKGLKPLTALIYGNKNWDVNWGSETVFVDNQGEIIKSIIPKPGRLVVFDATLPHTGRVPSSLFPHYRYSVVFNLISGLLEKTIL